MTEPPPFERYTWPTAPAGARRSRAPRPSVPPPPRPAGPGPTRRQGAVVGTVFAVGAVWGPVFNGVEPPAALLPFAIGIALAVVALAVPALRSFAAGFLLASLIGGIVAFVALTVLLVAIFANMGP